MTEQMSMSFLFFLLMDRQEHNVPPEDPVSSPSDPPNPVKDEVKAEEETLQDPVKEDTPIQEETPVQEMVKKEEPSVKNGFVSFVL